MDLPALRRLPDAEAYRAYFESEYVNGPSVVTADGITVQFYWDQFDHAFYKDSSRGGGDKTLFDQQRAERIDWIRALLAAPKAERYRRVVDGKVRCLTLDTATSYAAIIQLQGKKARRARFVTAYVANSASALAKMRSNPPWP